MGRKNIKKRYMALFAIVFFCAVLIVVSSWTSADENMPVTCYRADSRIGTVTVFDWMTAASTCNKVLYDCRGACVGCFRDSEYVTDVCIDNSGSLFLR